ncbi:MAG: potassium transporter [Chloroflexi bacterium]|nr:MAG: potassium transporter [Chloroflexota bacterium]
MNRGVQRRRLVAPAVSISLGLLGLIGAGTALLALPWSGTTRPLTLGEAAFTAVSALTTTGLSTIQPGRDLSVFGQIVLLLLMQLGAIGFTVLAVAIFRLLGRRITFAERVTLRDALGVVDLWAIMKLTQRVLLGVLAIEALGTLLLWLNWAGSFGPARALYLAIFHSVSAFCNASFDLFGGGGSTATNPFPSDAFTLFVIALMIALGSIGIPVLADLLDWRTHPRFTLHTKVTLGMWAILTVIGTALVLLSESVRPSAFGDVPLDRRALLAFFHVVASRTSGFNVQPIADLAPASVLTLTGLMFIGGAPASTAGGIRTSTFAVLVLAAGAYIRGADEIRVGRRAISRDTIQKAVAILIVSVAVVTVGAWLLMLTQETTFENALFEAVSAFATCGFSLGLTGELNGFGQLVVALLMIWGHLGPLTLVATISQTRHPSPVSYPEERILV